MIYEDVDLASLRSVEVEFSQATALGVITVDRRGEPVTPACGFSAFCLEIRKDPIRRQMCYACDAYGGLQSAMDGKPRIYRCHAGLVDFSIPIVVGENYLGAILCGQARVPRNADDPGYLISPTQTWQENPVLAELYTQIPQLNIKKVRSAANVLAALAKEITQTKLANTLTGRMPLPVERARELTQSRLSADAEANHQCNPSDTALPLPASDRRPELEAPQNPLADAVEADDLRASVHAVSMLLDSRLAPGSRFIADDQLTGVEDQLLELCQELCPKAATSLKYAVTQRRHRKASRSNRYNAQLYLESLLHILFDERRRAEPERQATVKDLVNELHRHPAKMWTLREASQILGVSLSYASKRFKAETGKSFINYVTDMRIERAKLMLAHTDMPAQRVAKELGFPPNYLSRVFKQVTGMTPSEYRAKNT